MRVTDPNTWPPPPLVFRAVVVTPAPQVLVAEVSLTSEVTAAVPGRLISVQNATMPGNDAKCHGNLDS